MRVNFYATLRQIVGGKTVEINLREGATVRELVVEMINRYPALEAVLLDEQGSLYGHVHVFINGRDAPFLENGMDTVLNADDQVSIFPAVGGGGRSLE